MSLKNLVIEDFDESDEIFRPDSLSRKRKNKFGFFKVAFRFYEFHLRHSQPH